jgi:hypothetical protein
VGLIIWLYETRGGPWPPGNLSRFVQLVKEGSIRIEGIRAATLDRGGHVEGMERSVGRSLVDQWFRSFVRVRTYYGVRSR